MEKIKWFIITTMIIALFSGCFESTTDEDDENGAETTDPLKSERLVASADSVVSEMIEEAGGEVSSGNMLDYIETAADLYKAAAAEDPTNSQANFGAAIFSFQIITENPDLKVIQETLESWNDDIDNLDHSKYIVTQYFLNGVTEYYMEDEWGGWYENIDPGSAFIMLIYMVRNSLSNQDVIALLQNLIDDTLIAGLDDAIKYIDRIHSDKDFAYVITTEMSGEDDVMEMDSGEVYMISAMMRVMRASLKIVNAYQLSVPGVNDISDYMDETTIIPLVKSQDENGGTFLKLRSTTILPSAKKDLDDALSMVQNGVNFITGETDSQLDDLIKKQDITEIDSEIDNELNDYASEVPVPVLRGAKGIVDLADKIKSILNGPIVIEQENGEEITVDISAFLNNAIPDIKTVLPYHEWKDLSKAEKEFGGPGAEIWEDDYYDVENIYIGALSTYIYAKGDYNLEKYYTFNGSISEDGIVTLEGHMEWNNEGFESVPFESEELLTTDGAFYIDSQKRLCITEEAYNFINSFYTNASRESREAIDLFYYQSEFPKYNFSADHPFGVRESSGVLKCSGSPEYGGDDDIIDLVDGNGNKVESPVFPDPTFGGVLPGMTQEKLMEFSD
ncbi:MAG: hypothetical protein HOC71_14825 [Candidatus Latescibacteria bacterium]|nr:hypothetical protein [Candidatus Latescibacterota bacterium]